MFWSRAAEKIKYYLSVGYYYLKLDIQRQIEYPLFLVTWFSFNFLQWFGTYYFLKVLAYRFNDIAGWKFPELIFLCSLSLISHGLMVIFFIQTWRIGNFIIKGEFDSILLRPMEPFFLFMVRNVNFVGIADLIPGLIIFAYSCALLNFKFTFISTAKIVTLVAGAVLIRTSLFMITNSVSFWNNNRDRMTRLLLNTIQSTSMYPLNMFPSFLQVALTFVIPIGFISYYPSLEMLGKDMSLPFVILCALIGIVLFLIGYFIFNIGIRKYESVGN